MALLYCCTVPVVGDDVVRDHGLMAHIPETACDTHHLVKPAPRSSHKRSALDERAACPAQAHEIEAVPQRLSTVVATIPGH